MIDEILELARLFEPNNQDAPEFRLSYEKGVWRAKVGLGRFFLEATGPTSDAALAELLHQQQAYARKIHSWAGRLLERLKPTLHS